MVAAETTEVFQGTHLNDLARSYYYYFNSFLLHSPQIMVIYDRLSIKIIDRWGGGGGGGGG